jgi:hypothetical protein
LDDLSGQRNSVGFSRGKEAFGGDQLALRARCESIRFLTPVAFGGQLVTEAARLHLKELGARNKVTHAGLETADVGARLNVGGSSGTADRLKVTLSGLGTLFCDTLDLAGFTGSEGGLSGGITGL